MHTSHHANSLAGAAAAPEKPEATYLETRPQARQRQAGKQASSTNKRRRKGEGRGLPRRSFVFSPTHVRLGTVARTHARTQFSYVRVDGCSVGCTMVGMTPIFSVLFYVRAGWLAGAQRR